LSERDLIGRSQYKQTQREKWIPMQSARAKNFERLRRFTAQPLVSSFEPDVRFYKRNSERDFLSPPRRIRKMISMSNQVAAHSYAWRGKSSG
jgi:hypothetical protein